MAALASFTFTHAGKLMAEVVYDGPQFYWLEVPGGAPAPIESIRTQMFAEVYRSTDGRALVEYHGTRSNAGYQSVDLKPEELPETYYREGVGGLGEFVEFCEEVRDDMADRLHVLRIDHLDDSAVPV